ncbi:MAG: MarR family transcriptional regulator [Planctomycetia bacterium]|nr:MarR family transcriptional regulator [Planctomycetia bacterium]
MPPSRTRRSPDSGAGRTGRAGLIQECVETLNEIFREVDVFSKRSLRMHGVSGPQLWAMRTIRRAGSVSMGQLAARMHLHVSTVTGIIDRLQEAGLVTRTRSSEDRRILHVAITEKGRKVVARAPEPPRSVIARGLEKIGRRDLASIRRSLAQLSRMMGVAGVSSGDRG